MAENMDDAGSKKNQDLLDEAKLMFDDFLAKSIINPGETLEHPLLYEGHHLIEKSWKVFRQHVKDHGCKAVRTESNSTEESTKRKSYIISVVIPYTATAVGVAASAMSSGIADLPANPNLAGGNSVIAEKIKRKAKDISKVTSDMTGRRGESTSKRMRHNWTKEEDEAFKLGIERYGKKFIQILEDPEFHHLLVHCTLNNLKDHYRQLGKVKEEARVLVVDELALDPTTGEKSKKPRSRWDEEETEALVAGLDRYGYGQWKKILEDKKLGPKFKNRNNVDLKDRARNLGVRKPDPGAVNNMAHNAMAHNAMAHHSMAMSGMMGGEEIV